MALTGSGLFNAVKAKLSPAQDAAMQEANLKPICEAIVEYITANAVVSTTDTIPALGLISGAPGSPVTGVASGTGTGTIA